MSHKQRRWTEFWSFAMVGHLEFVFFLWKGMSKSALAQDFSVDTTHNCVRIHETKYFDLAHVTILVRSSGEIADLPATISRRSLQANGLQKDKDFLTRQTQLSICRTSKSVQEQQSIIEVGFSFTLPSAQACTMQRCLVRINTQQHKSTPSHHPAAFHTRKERRINAMLTLHITPPLQIQPIPFHVSLHIHIYKYR